MPQQVAIVQMGLVALLEARLLLELFCLLSAVVVAPVVPVPIQPAVAAAERVVQALEQLAAPPASL